MESEVPAILGYIEGLSQPGTSQALSAWDLSPWCLVGNGGMDYGDYYYYREVNRDYYKDPFPHSLQSTMEKLPAWDLVGFLQIQADPKVLEHASWISLALHGLQN